MTNDPATSHTTHSGEHPDGATSSRRCRGPYEHDEPHGAPWAGQWIKDEIEKAKGMNMDKMRADPRQEALREAIKEAQRFIVKANKAYTAINDTRSNHYCPEFAAAKRASMDLTKALPKVRNTHG